MASLKSVIKKLRANHPGLTQLHISENAIGAKGAEIAGALGLLVRQRLAEEALASRVGCRRLAVLCVAPSGAAEHCGEPQCRQILWRALGQEGWQEGQGWQAAWAAAWAAA